MSRYVVVRLTKSGSFSDQIGGSYPTRERAERLKRDLEMTARWLGAPDSYVVLPREKQVDNG